MIEHFVVSFFFYELSQLLKLLCSAQTVSKVCVKTDHKADLCKSRVLGVTRRAARIAFIRHIAFCVPSRTQHSTHVTALLAAHEVQVLSLFPTHNQLCCVSVSTLASDNWFPRDHKTGLDCRFLSCRQTLPRPLAALSPENT